MCLKKKNLTWQFLNCTPWGEDEGHLVFAILTPAFLAATSINVHRQWVLWAVGRRTENPATLYHTILKNTCTYTPVTTPVNLQLIKFPWRAVVSSSATESHHVYFHIRAEWYLPKLGWRSLLIAGSYSDPEAPSSFLKLVSLCASSFHESSALLPPGHHGYQLMVNPQAEIRPTNTHPVLLVQWCSKFNSQVAPIQHLLKACCYKWVQVGRWMQWKCRRWKMQQHRKQEVKWVLLWFSQVIFPG